MFAVKHFDLMEISYEYIRGLTEGEGCFTFYKNKARRADGTIVYLNIPTFVINMHERDQELLEIIRNRLGLKNKIYNFKNIGYDGSNRGRKVVLAIRDLGQLKNIIIPFFYKKLIGNKGRQFEEWLNSIGSDPTVPSNFKILYRLYKSGWFDKNPKYID